MLEALLRKMVEKASVREVEDVEACLRVMVGGMRHHPDVADRGVPDGISEALWHGDRAGSFVHFVEQEIAGLKSHTYST